MRLPKRSFSRATDSGTISSMQRLLGSSEVVECRASLLIRRTVDITGDGRKTFHFKNRASRPPVHVMVRPVFKQRSYPRIEVNETLAPRVVNGRRVLILATQ